MANIRAAETASIGAIQRARRRCGDGVVVAVPAMAVVALMAGQASLPLYFSSSVQASAPNFFCHSL